MLYGVSVWDEGAVYIAAAMTVQTGKGGREKGGEQGGMNTVTDAMLTKD